MTWALNGIQDESKPAPGSPAWPGQRLFPSFPESVYNPILGELFVFIARPSQSHSYSGRSMLLPNSAHILITLHNRIPSILLSHSRTNSGLSPQPAAWVQAGQSLTYSLSLQPPLTPQPPFLTVSQATVFANASRNCFQPCTQPWKMKWRSLADAQELGVETLGGH